MIAINTGWKDQPFQRKTTDVAGTKIYVRKTILSDDSQNEV